MKFTVYTDEFKTALEKVNRVTGVKTSETLENVRIRKIGRYVHLLATNLNQFIDMKIECSTKNDIEFQFSDTKAIIKAMKFFTGHEIEFDCGENEIAISCGGKKAKQRILLADYPEFPTIDGNIHNELEYSNKKLKERFDAVKYAVSTEEHKGVLTGICFRDNDMTAIDGYRIAINKDESLNITTTFVAPVVALKNITEIMNEGVTITTNGKFMRVVDDKAVFITRLLDGEYMKYSHLITNNQDKSVAVDIKDFENGLKYLKTFKNTKDKTGVHWYGNKIAIKNINGYFESEVVINDEMNMEISFNGDFMLDAMGQFKKQVIVNMSTHTAPMLITSEEDTNNIALVLPVNMGEYNPRLFDDVVA